MFAALTIRSYRQGKIGNGDLLLRFVVFVLPLLVLSALPDLIGWGFDEFSFKRGGGRQVLGATVLAVGILYLFAFSLSGRQERSRRDLTRLIENLALEQFEQFGHPEAVRRRHRRRDPGLQRVREHPPRAGRAAGAGLRPAAARDRDRRRLGRPHHRGRAGGRCGRNPAAA